MLVNSLRRWPSFKTTMGQNVLFVRHGILRAWPQTTFKTLADCHSNVRPPPVTPFPPTPILGPTSNSPSKHETLLQCWFTAGTASATPAQQYTNIGATSGAS